MAQAYYHHVEILPQPATGTPVEFRDVQSVEDDENNTLVVNRPTGTVDGDYLQAIFITNVEAPIFTPPGGWTLLDSFTLATGGGNPMYGEIYEKVASSEPSTYTFQTNTFGNVIAAVAAFSNPNATPKTFGPTETLQTSIVASPASVNAAGGTAAENDCIVWWAAVILELNSTVTFAPPTNYTERLDIDATPGRMGLSLATRSGVSAGATGTITGTATSGGPTLRWATYVTGVASQ